MSKPINLHGTMDAEIWVKEWMKTIKKHPEIPTDEGTMLGWFANAIMAGYDAAKRKEVNLAKSRLHQLKVDARAKEARTHPWP